MREEKAVTLLYCWHVLAEEAKAEQLSARIYETYHLDLRTFTNTPVRDEAGISLELFSGQFCWLKRKSPSDTAGVLFPVLKITRCRKGRWH